MEKMRLTILGLTLVVVMGIMCVPIKGFVPFSRAFWDIDDPFRILEQSPLSLPKPNTNNIDGPGTGLALPRADWKETTTAHVISLDVPGMKKEDVKIEVVEENRVLRISGERKSEDEQEGDKWHRVERTSGKFWRQFRLPFNADLDHIKAHLEDGVLRVSVPKLPEEKKRQPKLVDIVVDKKPSGENLKATKADM